MRNRLPVLLIVMVLATLCVAGCGDDNDETVAPTVTMPATFTNGEIYTSEPNGLYLYVYTYVHGGGYPDIDSLKVGDLSADVNSSYYWNYADPYWYMTIYEDKDPSDYESGDEVVVSMYGSGRSSTCKITLLDYDDDEPEIISPASGTSVDEVASVEIVWNKIDLTEAAAGVERDEYGNIARVRVSARSGEGLELLRESLAEYARAKAESRQEALAAAAREAQPIT